MPRHIRALRIAATHEEHARHAALALQDAFHTASLPDDARCIFVRRLDLGRLPTHLSAQALARHIEQRFAQLAARAIPGDSAAASVAEAVHFGDAASALVHVARAMAGGATPAWFWPEAAPGWRSEATLPDNLARMLAYTLEMREGALAAQLLGRALIESGQGDALAAALTPALDAALWRATQAAGLAHDLPTHDLPAHDLPTHDLPTPILSGPARAAQRRWLASCAGGTRLYARAAGTPAALPARDLPMPSRNGAEHAARERIEAALTPRARRPPGTVPPPARATTRAANAPTPATQATAATVAREAPGTPALDTDLRPSPALPRKREGGRIVPAEAERPADIQPLLHAGAGRVLLGAPSRHAGLILTLAGLLRLGFSDWLAAHPGEHALPERLLRDLARRTGMPEGDAALAWLDEPRFPPGLAPLADWRQQLRRYCRVQARIGLADLIARPGRIAATPTHLEVFFDPHSIEMRIRRAGLDCDPGWVPWLARVVRFHYREDGLA